MAGFDTKLISLGVGWDRKKVGWDEVYILKEYGNTMVEPKQTNLSLWDKWYLTKHLCITDYIWKLLLINF